MTDWTSTEWKRGVGSGNSWKAEISGRMTTKGKSGWESLELYEKDVIKLPTYTEDFKL